MHTSRSANHLQLIWLSKICLLILIVSSCGHFSQINGQLSQTLSNDTCAAETSTVSTSSDGFLSNYIYYASFRRETNSTLRFRNPYAGQANITQAAVHLWIKLPTVSVDGASQRGRIFECNNTMSARLDDRLIGYNLTQNFNFTNGTTNATLMRTQQFATMHSGDNTLYLSWNHLAFSFFGRRMRIHINGVQVNETSLSYALTNTTRNADFCMVGNSQNYSDPLSAGFIRHLVFLNVGFPTNTSLTSRMRFIYSAADYYSSVLSYFQFSRYSQFNETYNYNSSRQIEVQNVTLAYESEPEIVCFQPSTSQQYLHLSQNYTLAPLNISAAGQSTNLSTGVVIQLWLFPLRLRNESQNSTTILKITNFTDIILTNANLLNINLYNENSSGIFLNQTIIFSSRRLPFHTWTLLTFQVTNNQTILYFDAQEIERRNHSTNLTQNLTSFLISTDLGLQLETLMNRFSISHRTNQSANSSISTLVSSIYNSPSTFQNLSSDAHSYIINVQTTQSQLKNGSYVSDGIFNGFFDNSKNDSHIYPANLTFGFQFQQNNLLSVGQNDSSLAALWNAISGVCRNLRFSPLFNDGDILSLNSNQSSLNISQMSGQNNSLRFQIAPNDTYTIDFWFKISPNLSAQVNNTLQNYKMNLQAQSNLSQDFNSLRFLQENNEDQVPADNISNSFLDRLSQYGYNQTIISSYETLNSSLLPMLKISLNIMVTNTSFNYSLDCNPFSRDPTNSNLTLRQTSLIIQEGAWMHYSCLIDNSIKNSSSNQTLLIQSLLQNSLTKAEENLNAQSLQNYQASNITQPILVFIASSNDSTDQFTGFLKEIRIFAGAISQDLMRTIRYQKTPTLLRQSMVYYVGLSNGLNTVVDDRSRSSTRPQIFLSQTNSQSSYKWVLEDQLIICNRQQYFNGRCCVPLILTASISQQETQDLLIITSQISQDPLINQQSNFTWRLTSVLPNNTAYFNQLNNTLSSQINLKTLSFNRSSLFRNSSFILQLSVATIYSTLPSTQTYAVIITCPLLNIDWPQNTLLHPCGYTPKLSLNALISTDCYNQTITARSINWTYNFTLGDPSTLSTSRTNLTFTNETRILNDTLYQVNLSVNFSNNQVLNSTRLVRYLSRPINLNINATSFYLPANQPMIIDASQTQFLANTINSSLLGLHVNCFTPLQFANQSCSFNSSGFFVVNNSILQSSNPIIPYVDYFFNISAGQPNTSLLLRQNVQARWFNPFQQTPSQSCPGISTMEQVNVSKQNVTNFIFSPTFYLDCLQNDQVTYSRFNITNISYQFDSNLVNQYSQQFNQSLGIRNFSEGFITQNNSLVFRINNTIVSRIKAGDIIPINITMNATNGTSNLTFTDSKILLINVVFADIVIVANSTANSSGFIAFENPLVLNASLSYDPDMNVSASVSNNSMLNYTYLCNGRACSLNSTQMRGGVIQMTILDALNLSYAYLTPYNFSIGVQNTLILRKPIQWANFTVIFLPPNKVGTVNCPRVYFIRQNSSQPNSTVQRQTNFTFNTINATNAEWRVSYENCDTFTTYTPLMMLVDIGFAELTDNQTIQMQSRNLNATNITISRQRQLNNIKLLQQSSIRATLVFNFTNTTTRVSRLGYSSADLLVFRNFSFLQPVSNISTSVQIPYEETLIVSNEGSFDPDYPFRNILPTQTFSSLQDLNSPVPLNYIPGDIGQFMAYKRTCSRNLEFLCPSLQILSPFSISKLDRESSGVKSIGSTFWISTQIDITNRDSLVLNSTFQVVAQNYSKCIIISDKNQNISIQQDQYRMMRYLRPQIISDCDFIEIYGNLAWSSSAQQQFWQVNAFSNLEAVITPEAIMQQAQDQNLRLSLSLQYYPLEFSDQMMTTPPFNYTIRILPAQPKLVINVTEPLDLSQLSAQLNIYLNQSLTQNTSLASCNVSASINNELIENLTQSQQCSFDIMAALSTIYQPSEIASLKLLVIFANMTLQDGQIYSTKKAITLTVNGLAPLCQVRQETNPFIQLDKPLTLSASAKDLTVGQLDFFWDTQSYFREFIPTVRELSRLTLDPFSLLSAQGKNLIIESSINSVGQDAASQNDCRAPFLISLPSNENIILGNPSIMATDHFLQGEIVSLFFSNEYKDINQGDLLMSIYYLEDGRNYTLLTKSLFQNLTLIIPQTQNMFVQIIDQLGATKLQQIDLSNMTLPQSSDIGIQFVSFYQKFMGVSSLESISFLESQSINIEILLGMFEQVSLRFNAVQDALLIEQLYLYYQDILFQSQSLLKTSKTFLNLQDSRVNAQFIALRTFRNLMQNWARLNFSAPEWSTENNTFMASYLQTMTNIPRKIYERMIMEVDPSLMQIDSLEAKWMADVYNQLISSMLLYSNLSPSEYSELQQSMKSISDSQLSRLNPGESLEIASQNLVIQKIDINDMPKAGFTSSNKDIEFTVTRDQLTDLLDQQAYLNMQIMDSSAYNNQNVNLTLASDIVTINFTSLNGSEIEFKDKTALISFSNIDTTFYKGLTCSYWDEDSNIWLYSPQDARLTTQIVINTRQVYCKTTHLSTFAVFNLTIYPDNPDPGNGGQQGDKKTRWEETPTSTKRIIISIIQIVFILVAINAFIINTRFEFQKAMIFKEHSYASLQHRLKIIPLFLQYSKLIQIYLHDRAPLVVRIQITLAYILFVVFMVLLNLVFLSTERVVEDDVYLDFTIWLVITLLGPYIINITLYKFYQFIPQGQFTDILQSKSLGPYSQRQGNSIHKGSSQNPLSNIAKNQKEEQGQVQSSSNPGINNHNTAPFQNMIYDSVQEMKSNGGNPLKKSQLTQQYQSQQLHTSANMILIRNAEIAGPEDVEEESKINRQLDSDKETQQLQQELQTSMMKNKKYRTQKFLREGTLDSTDHKLGHPIGEDLRQSIEFENDTEIEAAKRTAINVQDSSSPRSLRSRHSLKSNQEDYAAGSIESNSQEGTPKAQKGLSGRNINQLSMNLNAQSLKKINDLQHLNILDKSQSDSDDVEDSDSDRGEEATTYNNQNQQIQARRNNYGIGAMERNYNLSGSQTISNMVNNSQDPTQVHSQYQGNGGSQINRNAESMVVQPEPYTLNAYYGGDSSGRKLEPNQEQLSDPYNYGQNDNYGYNQQNQLFAQDNIQQEEQDEQEFQFEGGAHSDDDQGYTAQRMTSNQNQAQQRSRAARYELSEADPSQIHPNRIQQLHSLKDIEEKVVIQTKLIVIIYTIVLLCLIAADLVLFYYSQIEESIIYKAFIADLLISIGLQIFVLDLLVCVAAGLIIRNTGLQKIASVKGVIVFGFFNVSRLRAM